MPEVVRQHQREPASAASSLRPPAGSISFPGLFQAGEAAAESAWVSLHFDLWLKCFFSGHPLKAPPMVLVIVRAGSMPLPPSSSITGSENDGWAARLVSEQNGPAQGREAPASGGSLERPEHRMTTPRTAAHQAPPSMGFSRQECWSGLPFPYPGDLPDPGIEPRSPSSQADALPSEPPGKPYMCVCVCVCV